MNVLYFVLPLIIVAFLAAPVYSIYRGLKTGRRAGKARRAFAVNICSFFGVCLLMVALSAGGVFSAADTAQAAVAAGGSISDGLGYIAAALVTGMAALGAGIAVAAAAPAAIGAFSEDPKAFGKALIFVALGEGVAIYGLLISILILNKI